LGNWYGDFFGELKAAIQSAWPEISDSQFYTAQQSLHEDLVQAITRGLAGDGDEPAPPIAVLCIGSFARESSYGLGNLVKRAPVTVWYAASATDQGDVTNQSAVQEKLYGLATAIDEGDFASFQSIENASVDSSEANRQNALGLNAEIVAGSVSWEPGLLVGEIVV